MKTMLASLVILVVIGIALFGSYVFISTLIELYNSNLEILNISTKQLVKIICGAACMSCILGFITGIIRDIITDNK